MFPADGQNSKRDLIDWEVCNCPWYLDSDHWSTTFDQTEKLAYTKISKGEEPNFIWSEIKFGPVEKEDRACVLMEDVCLRQGISVDRTRQSKGKIPIATKPESQKRSTSQQSLRTRKYS